MEKLNKITLECKERDVEISSLNKIGNDFSEETKTGRITDIVLNEWVSFIDRGFSLINMGTMVRTIKDINSNETLYFNPRTTVENIPESMDDACKEMVQMFGREETIRILKDRYTNESYVVSLRLITLKRNIDLLEGDK